MTKKSNIALPPQFNKMKRPPAKTSLAMKRSIERAKELYPEGRGFITLSSNVPYKPRGE
jgi:hypothetical protein